MRAVRPTALLAAAAVGVLALAACGTGGDATQPAATVDGTTITQQAVVDELEAVRSNQAYVDGVQALGNTILGTAPDTFANAYVNSVLALQIQYQLVLNEVDSRGLDTSSDDCQSAAHDQALSRLAGLTPDTNGDGSPDGDGSDLFAAFPEDYQHTLVARNAALLALEADLVDDTCGDPDSARKYYDAHEDDFQEPVACVSHILVSTLDEANEISLELAAGADFAETAVARSIDPAAKAPAGQRGAGGDYGCFTQSAGFVQEFIDAAFSQPVGEVGPPVQTQFGYHLIKVSFRGVPTSFEQVQSSVEDALANEIKTQFQSWFTATVQNAQVEVDPRYGTWNGPKLTVDPPASATTTTSSPAQLVPDPSGG